MRVTDLTGIRKLSGGLKPMQLLIISIFLMIFLLLMLLFFLYIANITPSNRDSWIVVGTVSAPVVAFFALCFFIWQTNIQTKTYNIENRPYLHAMLKGNKINGEYEKYHFGPDIDDKVTLHGPGYLYLVNDGKVPATILGKPEYIVRSNECQNTDLMGYFDRLGGFPHVRIVFPKREDIQPIPLTPGIGKKPILVQVYAKVVYTGADPDKKYWYIFDHLYALKYSETEMSVELVDPFEDWDRNSGKEPPPYKAPKWGKLLSDIEKRK
jgi:hypothetical protein